MNFLRPTAEATSQIDLVSYMEYQRYLDFRECADHALAALHLTETFEIEHLCIGAFAHCVGMHYKLHDSLDFEVSCYVETRVIISAI